MTTPDFTSKPNPMKSMFAMPSIDAKKLDGARPDADNKDEKFAATFKRNYRTSMVADDKVKAPTFGMDALS